MSFQQIQKLAVKRTLSDGSQVFVGELAQNRQGGYFQYLVLNADFRMLSLDYEDLIKATSLLCKSPAAGQVIFRRMIFN